MTLWKYVYRYILLLSIMPPCATMKSMFKCVYKSMYMPVKEFECHIGFIATYKSTYNTSPLHTAYIHLFWFNVFRFVRDIYYTWKYHYYYYFVRLNKWVNEWVGAIFGCIAVVMRNIINDMQLNMEEEKKKIIIIKNVFGGWCMVWKTDL